MNLRTLLVTLTIPHHHSDLQGWPNQPMKARALSHHLAWPQLKAGLRGVGQGLHECWLWTLWIAGLPPPLTSSENTYTQTCAIWTRLDAWMEFCNEEAEGRAPWGEEQHERQHSGMSMCHSRRDWGLQGVIRRATRKWQGVGTRLPRLQMPS